MNSRIPTFETDRLLVFPLTISDYEKFESGIEPDWQAFTNPYKHLIEGPSPLLYRIPRVKKDPMFAEIGLLLAVEKDTNIVVGSSGFHDFPDERGMIEVGFGIVPVKQNQGFGKELLIGMWKFISSRTDVRVLRYTVSPDNAPSMHIIHKLGFTQVGEQVDPEDGVELIFEELLVDFLARKF